MRKPLEIKFRLLKSFVWSPLTLNSDMNIKLKSFRFLLPWRHSSSSSLNENDETWFCALVFRIFCRLTNYFYFNCLLSGPFSICGYRPLTETIRRSAPPFLSMPVLLTTFQDIQPFPAENGEWKRKEDGDNWHTKDQRSWLARKKRYAFWASWKFVAVLIQEFPFSDAISRLTLSHVEVGQLERTTSFSELQIREWFRCFSAQCPTGRMDKELLAGRDAKSSDFQSQKVHTVNFNNFLNNILINFVQNFASEKWNFPFIHFSPSSSSSTKLITELLMPSFGGGTGCFVTGGNYGCRAVLLNFEVWGK